MLTKKVDQMQSGTVGMQLPATGPANAGFTAGSAANVAYFNRNQMQARRLRRQTRMSRQGGSLRVGGWSVRSW